MSESSETRRKPVSRRLVAALLIAGSVAAMGVTDRFVARPTVVVPQPLADAGPLASADDARSSTWFCTGGNGRTETGTVVSLVNPTDGSRSGSVRIVGPTGDIGTSQIVLAPGQRVEVELPVLKAPPAAATATNDPATNDPATNDPVTNDPATNDPATNDPVTNDPATPGIEASSGAAGSGAAGNQPTSTTQPDQFVAGPELLGVEAERGTGAVVEFNGGGVVAEHRIGESVAPCAAAASSSWYLPDGVSVRGATTAVTLFNPFADDAIVDILAVTESGRSRPSALQGVVVPAGSVRTVDLDSFVRRRDLITATIETRTGRVIAEGFRTSDGTVEVAGASIVLAAPSLGSAWYFPSGRTSKVFSEEYTIANPGERDLTVELVFISDGVEEPHEIDVPAGGVVQFATADEERVPDNVSYSVAVSSPTDQLFVVGRKVIAESTFRRGVASTLGVRILSNRWTLADAATNATADDVVSMLNPTNEDATVSMYHVEFDPATGSSNSTDGTDGVSTDSWTPVDGVEQLALPAGSRLDVRLGDFLSLQRGAVVVASDGAPIIVDRTRVAVRSRGPRPRRPLLVASVPEGDDFTDSGIAVDVGGSADSNVGGDSGVFGDSVPGGSEEPSVAAAVTVAIPRDEIVKPAVVGGRGFSISAQVSGSTSTATTGLRPVTTTTTTPTTPTTTTTPTTPTTTSPASSSLASPASTTSLPVSSSGPPATAGGSVVVTTSTFTPSTSTFTPSTTTKPATTKPATTKPTTAELATTTRPITSTTLRPAATDDDDSPEPPTTPLVSVARVASVRIGTSTAMAIPSAGG